MTYWRDSKVAYIDTYDELVVETEKALLVRWGDRKEWIPLSQVIDHDPEEKSLVLKYWIVEQKDLEDLVEDEGYE